MTETIAAILAADRLGARHRGRESALTTADILGPSEAFRAPMDDYAHAPNGRDLLSRLAAFKPTTPACMDGTDWQGDAAWLLLALADCIAPE